MVRLIAILLLCISLNVSAEYGEKEHKQILGIYHDCISKHYNTQECRLAMQSNIDIKIPEFVMCNLNVSLEPCGKK